MDRIDNGAGDLALNLLFFSAAQSSQVTVRLRNGEVHARYPNLESIPENNRAGINQGELFAHYTYLNWSAINLINPQQQQTPKAPFFRNEGPSIDDKKLRDCISSLFIVNTTSYEIGERFAGKSDYYDWFGGGVQRLLDDVFFGTDRSDISVTTTKTSVNRIKWDAGTLFNPAANAGVVVGYTNPDGKSNFVVNDYGVSIFRDSIWVYELGNALGIQTGYHPLAEDEERRYNNLGANDKGGPALVDCVFGGRINENGRISRPPSTHLDILQ